MKTVYLYQVWKHSQEVYISDEEYTQLCAGNAEQILDRAEFCWDNAVLSRSEIRTLDDEEIMSINH